MSWPPSSSSSPLNDILNVTVVASFGEKKFAIRQESKDDYAVVNLAQDEGPVQSVGTSISRLERFLKTDATVLKVILQKGFYRHDLDNICSIANRFILAIAQNTNTKYTIVTLQGLHAIKVTQGLQNIFASQQDRQSTFVLGFYEMAEHTPDDLMAIQESMRSLSPWRLGLQLYGSCQKNIFEATLRGAAKNNCLFLLALDEVPNDGRVQSLVDLLNHSDSSLVSLGFPRGSFEPHVADALLNGLEQGCGSQRLIISDSFFDQELTTSLCRLLTQKFTKLTGLVVSDNEFTTESFGTLCQQGLLPHKSIKTWVAQNCKLRTVGHYDGLATGLANLFRQSTVLETIRLDRTPLHACDGNVWQNLAENQFFRKVTLHDCFRSSASWVEIYSTIEPEYPITLSWRLGKVARLEIWLLGGEHSRLIELTQVDGGGNRGTTEPSYDWLLGNVKKTSESSQELVLERAVMDKDAGRLANVVADALACVNVVSLHVHGRTKQDALTLLNQAIPKANPDFSDIEITWADDFCYPAVEKDFETNLLQNKSLVTIDCPSHKNNKMPYLVFVPLRNQVSSVSPETPSILPSVIESFSATGGSPTRDGHFISTSQGKRSTAAFSTLQLFAQQGKLNHVAERLENDWIEAKMEEAKRLEQAKLEEERLAAERQKKAREADEQRLAAEQRQRVQEAEMARLRTEQQKVEEERMAAAEEKRLEAERRKAEEEKAEEERMAAERSKVAEERLVAERRKAEEDRLATERRKAEEARVAAENLKAEQRRAEEERLEAERWSAAEEALAAEQQKAEKERIAFEQHRIQEEKLAAEQRRKDEEAKEERLTAELRVAEAERLASEWIVTERRAERHGEEEEKSEIQPNRPRNFVEVEQERLAAKRRNQVLEAQRRLEQQREEARQKAQQTASAYQARQEEMSLHRTLAMQRAREESIKLRETHLVEAAREETRAAEQRLRDLEATKAKEAAERAKAMSEAYQREKDAVEEKAKAEAAAERRRLEEEAKQKAQALVQEEWDAAAARELAHKRQVEIETERLRAFRQSVHPPPQQQQANNTRRRWWQLRRRRRGNKDMEV